MQKLQHLHGFDALDCYTKNAEDLADNLVSINGKLEFPWKFALNRLAVQ